MGSANFPVMVSDRFPRDGPALVGPRSIPWHVVAPFEDQAKRNHDQSLERLAQRGGLDPIELLLVLTGRKLFPFPDIDEQDALDSIVEIVKSHEEDTPHAD